MPKQIDENLILANIKIATTIETNIGYVSESKNALKIINVITKKFNKLITASKKQFTIAKQISADFYYQKNMIGLLLYIDNPKNREQVEKELEFMRTEFNKFVDNTHKVIEALNIIVRNGKRPFVVNGQDECEEVFIKRDENTLVVKDPMIYEYIQGINFKSKKIDLSDSKIEINGNTFGFAVLDKKITKLKNVSKNGEYIVEEITVLSVNSDDMNFRFKNAENSTLVGHYGNLDNRYLLLDAQRQDLKINCRMSFIEEVSLTKNEKKDFKLIEFVNDSRIMKLAV